MKSMLFTPADKPSWAEKAWKFSPDAVILDLEDSIALNSKEYARKNARNILESSDSQWYVRLNSRNSGLQENDIKEVLHENLKGLVLPKIQDKEDIIYFQNILKVYSKKNNIDTDDLRIIPVIENTRGLVNLREIASCSPAITAIGYGGGDFSLDIGLNWDPSSLMIKHLMAQLVIESRYDGLETPHDSVYPNYRDVEGLRAACKDSRSMGFGTKHALHPDQVPVINEVFSPTGKELENARKIKEEFERKESEGSAALGVDGNMVDYPVYKNALRVLREGGKDE